MRLVLLSLREALAGFYVFRRQRLQFLCIFLHVGHSVSRWSASGNGWSKRPQGCTSLPTSPDTPTQGLQVLPLEPESQC